MGIFDFFCPVTLTLTHDDIHIQSWPYCLELYYRMYKYELPTSRLSKVIDWKTYRHTDRQNRPKL